MERLREFRTVQPPEEKALASAARFPAARFRWPLRGVPASLSAAPEEEDRARAGRAESLPVRAGRSLALRAVWVWGKARVLPTRASGSVATRRSPPGRPGG